MSDGTVVFLWFLPFAVISVVALILGPKIIINVKNKIRANHTAWVCKKCGFKNVLNKNICASCGNQRYEINSTDVRTQNSLNQANFEKTETNNPVPAAKKIITSDDLLLEKAIDIYTESKHDHFSCPNGYDFRSYFLSAFDCIVKNLPRHEIELSEEKVLRQNEITNPICEYKNITKSSNLDRLSNFIAIDTETTGLKPGGNDIIEICAIRFYEFKPYEVFHTYLKPRKPIPAEAQAINHITDDMVVDAPKFSQIKSDLQKFIGKCPLVAHNARFDMKFLHVSGLDLSGHTNKIYDTLSLSKKFIKDYDGEPLFNYKLGTVCSELNISLTNAHSALEDTLACGILFVDIIKKIHDVSGVSELLYDV